ncbi:MAG: HAD hydrolase-like protein [bacterium]|nr:HAD hydrolase-like protein [bacterium]
MFSAGIFNYFEHIFNSSDIGVKKPDMDFINHVKSLLIFHSDEAIYIDDSENNCFTGTSMGIQSHYYKDLENLELFLSKEKKKEPIKI